MAYAILSDSHFHNWNAYAETNGDGVNTRLIDILDTFELCAKNLASCLASCVGSTNIYHGGDLFHERGKIPPSVINYVNERLQIIHEKYGVYFYFMPGNHDMEFNDSLTLGHATKALACDWVTVIDDTTEFEDDKVIMVPWYDKLDDLREHCEGFSDREDWDLIIHAPVNGVISGIPDHGLEAQEVAGWGFGRVFVGHYHSHKTFCDGKVVSIGATTHQTWSDVGTLAGFIIVDGDNVTHCESDAPKFIDYEEFESMPERKAQRHIEGNYVRVQLGECSEEEIRTIRDGLAGLGAKAIKIVATPADKSVQRSDTAVESGQSLEQSITSYIDASEIAEKEAVKAEVMEIIENLEEAA